MQRYGKGNGDYFSARIGKLPPPDHKPISTLAVEIENLEWSKSLFNFKFCATGAIEWFIATCRGATQSLD